MFSAWRPWFFCSVAVLAVIWGRLAFSSHESYGQAEKARELGKTFEAIELYEQAIRSHTFFSESSKLSVSALLKLAGDANADKRFDVALASYRALRRSIRSIRSMIEPYSEHAFAIDQAIAELMAKEQLRVGGPTVRGRTQEQLVSDHMALLRLEPAPSRVWSFVIIFSFIGWLLATLLTIWRGLDREGRIQMGNFARYGIVAIICFGIWTVSLMNA